MMDFLIQKAYAVDGYIINTTIPGVSNSGDPVETIAGFYKFALMIAGLLAFGSIIWAGIQYAISSGNPGKQGDARDQITQAFLGILLLLGAYLILNTINPTLTNLSLPKLKPLEIETADYKVDGSTLGTCKGKDSGTCANGYACKLNTTANYYECVLETSYTCKGMVKGSCPNDPQGTNCVNEGIASTYICKS